MQNISQNTPSAREEIVIDSIAISNTFMDDLIRKYSKYTMDVIFFSLTIITTYLLSAENPIVNVSVTAFETLVGYRHQALRAHKHYEEKLLMQWIIIRLFANTEKHRDNITQYRNEIEVITKSHWLLSILPFGITLRGKDKGATKVGLLVLIFCFIPAILIHAKSISKQENISHLPLIVWVFSFTFATALRHGNSSLLAKANHELLKSITSIENISNSQHYHLGDLKKEAQEVIKSIHSDHDSSLRNMTTDLLIDIAKENPGLVSTQPSIITPSHSSNSSSNEGETPQENRSGEILRPPTTNANNQELDGTATIDNNTELEGSTLNYLYTAAFNFYTTSSELVDNSMTDLARTVNRTTDNIHNAAPSWFSIR